MYLPVMAAQFPLDVLTIFEYSLQRDSTLYLLEISVPRHGSTLTHVKKNKDEHTISF